MYFTKSLCKNRILSDRVNLYNCKVLYLQCLSKQGVACFLTNQPVGTANLYHVQNQP